MYGRVHLRGEDQPAAVRRPTVPGVHACGVVAQASRGAARGRDDVQLAVGLQQHVALGLAEDDPLAVRRVLREEVAHPVVRGALQRLRRSALPVVERDPVQVVAKGLLLHGELRDVLLVDQGAVLLIEALRVVGLRPGEHDLLAVGAPHRVGLHVLRVVGPRQRRKRLRLPIVDDENAFDGKEELRDHEVRDGDEHRPVLDRADHVPSRRRDPRQQPEGELAVLALVVRPRDDLRVVHHHVLRHRHDAVGALVVAVVDVEPENAAVVREGVTVAAHGQVLQHDRRAGLRVDGSEAPTDAGWILHGRQKRQRNLSIEQRIADLVLRRANVHARR